RSPPPLPYTTLFRSDRLLADRLVRKNTNPGLAATLDVTRHGTTSRFDLTGSNAATLDRFQPILTKADFVATLRQTTVAALMLFRSEEHTSELQSRFD